MSEPIELDMSPEQPPLTVNQFFQKYQELMDERKVVIAELTGPEPSEEDELAALQALEEEEMKDPQGYFPRLKMGLIAIIPSDPIVGKSPLVAFESENPALIKLFNDAASHVTEPHKRKQQIGSLNQTGFTAWEFPFTPKELPYTKIADDIYAEMKKTHTEIKKPPTNHKTDNS